jgi:predicted amidohydrolase YtcJ
MPADLIVLNAHIHTLDPSCPHATALAVRDGRFLAVGQDAEVTELRGPETRVIDLNGRSVLPGLCDAHIHFTAYALGLQRINLFEVPSLAELQRRLAEKARTAVPDTWLLGFGWNHTLWPGGQFPTRFDLDDHAPDHPVLLWEKSGHAVVANSAALAQAGIGPHTPDPAGGQIVRDASGIPTGVLLEAPAIDLVEPLIPEPTETELDAAVVQAQARVHRLGLTAIHDLDGKRGFGAFQRLRLQGKLRLRTVSHVAMEQLEDALGLGLRAGLGDGWLRMGGLKLFADGALGPRTAAMLAPYENEPANYGITIVDKEEMVEMVARASAAGLPTLVHAIGDRANHDVLDVFETVRRQEAERNEPPPARRHRIEHVQLLHPDDLPRLAELDVIASMQPIHATQDMRNVDAFWGERGRLSYAFRSLLASGVRLAFGSDAPVETPNPFVGIHAAVTRRRADGSPGPEGWYPEQRLSVAETVAAYTTGAAYAEGWEDEMGCICPGKVADFVVPDRDIFTCDPMAILDTAVQMTVVGGEVVHEQ